MWYVKQGYLCDAATERTLSPQNYGQPLYFEDLGELHFSAADAVLAMSMAEFNQFSIDYEKALQLNAE
jgi:hypothetical protein